MNFYTLFPNQQNLIMKLPFHLILFSVAFASFASCSKHPPYSQEPSETRSTLRADENHSPEAIVFKAAGDINPALNEFRDLLGPLNTVPGAVGGHREINWDAVPAAFTNNNLFPGNFFGASGAGFPDGRKRGFISTT